MYNIICIFIGKLIMSIMRLLKFKSSVYPGYIVKKLNPNILNKIKFPKLVIMVTGSSGKGSTTNIIYKMLKDCGYDVSYNSNGSNLINAFITTCLEYCNFKGVIKKDALIFEVDEKFLKEITKYVRPNYLIINNITRDQPPRQGSFDNVFNEIKKGIYDDMHLIVNGDDPITRKFSLYHKGKITYFGIEKNNMSFTKPINYIKDYLYCPNCNSKLEFDYYHYGSVGKYKCTSCDFKRENIEYSITKIDRKNMNITINNEYKINISNYALFNLYNLCASFALSNLLNIDKEKVINSLSKYNLSEKIFQELLINDRKYVILNCKAENNATYNLSLLYTSLDKDKKTIVLGLNEISRRYNFYDLSWLWDISFELLNDNNVDKVICAGPYRYDIATRIKFSGIDKKNIIILDDLDNVNEVIKNKTDGTVYGILNFDYVDPFIKSIKEEK